MEKVMRFLLALSAVLALMAAALPAAAQQQGRWYGGYTANVAYGDLSLVIDLEIDQLPNGRTGQAFLSITTSDRCPVNEMRPSLCAAIQRAIATVESQQRSSLDAFVMEGVVIEESRALIGFSLWNDDTVRIAELAQAGSGFMLTIHEASQGVELSIPVQWVPHSCTMTMCTADRLDDLRADPASYGGVIGTPNYLTRYASLRAGQTATSSQPQPQPPTQPVSSSGEVRLWDVVSALDGRTLGELYLRGNGGAMSGDGVLDSIAFGNTTEVRIAPERSRGSGFGLAVTFFASGSGERNEALLLLGAERAGVFAGSFVEGTYVEPIRLVLDNSVGPMDFGGAQPGDFEAEELFDLPGIGITGPSYVLRNVPAGQRLAVREAPDRTAVIAGTLPRDARDILVLSCDPDIDTLAFEEGTIAAKRRLLDGSWCYVSQGFGPSLIEGWVVGGYLEPVIDAGGL